MMIMSATKQARRCLTLADGERLKASLGSNDRKPLAAAPVSTKAALSEKRKLHNA
jgi:hypothetical protein